MMDTDQLTFEVERFEWVADDRLEVSGRWFGVRGRRFMRPTLHVRVAGRRRRMIAVLDHKPWSPDEEGTWIAAFAWRGTHDDVTAVRLEGGTDIVLELPPPGEAVPGTTITPRPRQRREPRPVTAPKRPPAERQTLAAPAWVSAAAAEPEPTAPPAAEPDAAPAVEPDTVAPPVAEPTASSAAAELRALALERRLLEERSERERLAEELAAARAQLQ